MSLCPVSFLEEPRQSNSNFVAHQNSYCKNCNCLEEFSSLPVTALTLESYCELTINSNYLNNMKVQTLKKISGEQSIQFSFLPSPSSAYSLIIFKLQMEGRISHANVPCVVLTKINIDKECRGLFV